MKHIIVPANTRRFSWRNPNGDVGWFEPNGRLAVSRPDVPPRGLVANKAGWSSSTPLYSARIFVGFNVDGEPMWEIEDAMTIVRRVREAQVGTPDSTFLYQRGLYTSKKHKGQVENEEGTQIILINLPEFGTKYREFRQQMLDLAEELATELRQEEVIVEIQKGGISKETVGVNAR